VAYQNHQNLSLEGILYFISSNHPLYQCCTRVSKPATDQPFIREMEIAQDTLKLMTIDPTSDEGN
jgi:hypothetical protein